MLALKNKPQIGRPESGCRSRSQARLGRPGAGQGAGDQTEGFVFRASIIIYRCLGQQNQMSFPRKLSQGMLGDGLYSDFDLVTRGPGRLDLPAGYLKWDLACMNTKVLTFWLFFHNSMIHGRFDPRIDVQTMHRPHFQAN